MSYLVLARKWRPQTFDEIVGQEHVSRTLKNAISSDRVAHGFLFTGVRGVGKTTAARVLAKALNCADGPTPTPCNACLNCTEITQGNAVDVLEIDGASNTGVDDVRQIIENVRYQPARSRFKIYIIDEVHMLSTSAFNALLKTLEEPPAHVKFILATTDPHKVPHTIHSRCQRYDFRRIPIRLIADRLAQIAASDGIEVSEQALFWIAREAEGSMRDSQSLFDQVIAYAGSQVDDADVGAALGLADRRLLLTVAGGLVDRDAATALARLAEAHDFGCDLRRFTRDLLEHFRHLTVQRLLPDSDLLEELPSEERKEITRQAAAMDGNNLDRAFRLLLEAETELPRVAYPKLLLDMVLLKIATLEPVLPAETLLERLDAIRRSAPRPAGGAPRVAAASAGPATASRPRRKPENETTQAPEPVPPPPPGERSWDGFLEFVGKRKVTVLAYVQASEVPDLGAKVLGLAVPDGYYYDYLAMPDHTRAVEELAEEYFGEKRKITVTARDSTKAEPAPKAPTAAEMHATAMEDPKVKDAIEVLGGQLREVKRRDRRKA